MRVEGTLLAGTSTDWYIATGNTGIHIAGKNFVGATPTVTVQETVNGNTYSVHEAGTALQFTAAFDQTVQFREGDKFRLNVAGGTSFDYLLTGEFTVQGANS